MHEVNVEGNKFNERKYISIDNKNHSCINWSTEQYLGLYKNANTDFCIPTEYNVVKQNEKIIAVTLKQY